MLLHTAVGSCCVPGLWVSFHCTSFPLHAFCPGSGRNSRRNLLLRPICNLLLAALSHGLPGSRLVSSALANTIPSDPCLCLFCICCIPRRNLNAAGLLAKSCTMRTRGGAARAPLLSSGGPHCFLPRTSHHHGVLHLLLQPPWLLLQVYVPVEGWLRSSIRLV